jgi:hypothetical protein
MQISQQAVSVGFSMLNLKEDKILEILGESLYQIEAQQTCSNLGTFTLTDKRLKAEEFIKDNLASLRKAIHPKWTDKTRETFEQNTVLFSDFISDVGDSLRHFSAFVSLAVIVAAWIINKRVDKFCR